MFCVVYDSVDMCVCVCVGFVGLFSLLLLWPGFVLLHYSGLELFEMPNRMVISYILINGLIGTVLSEFLWLWYVTWSV